MPHTYVIGDIHGCCKTFLRLVEEGIRPTPEDEIICVGDYIDRGPDSKGVIDFIMELRQQGHNVHTLRGNHEQLLLDSIEDDEAYESWEANGGTATLLSFGIQDVLELPDLYLTFFRQTKLYHMTDNWIIVHAGLNFDIEDPFSDIAAMLWTRKTYVDLTKTGGRSIIHGHTPITLEEIAESRLTNSINIDGGCFRKEIPGLGHLVAIELDSLELIVTKNCE
jgi:serine/threonine protein phosphatase 1